MAGGLARVLAAAFALGAGGAAAQEPLAAAADRFFTTPALSETRAFTILIDGKPVYERYAPGYTPATRLIGWSMSKSVTSTIIGQLVDARRLQLDAPAPVPEWHAKPGDPRARITLRHLLNMASGLSHQENSPTPEDDDTVRVLFTDRAADAAAWSERKPLYQPPGAGFRYSTATTVILADIAERTLFPGASPLARRQGMRAYLVAHIARPAGMPSLICEFDRAGTLLGGSFCHATLRDWAAFGEVYLHDGMGPGGRVVSADWVRFVRTPSPTEPGYGGQFWLNHERAADKHPALFPGVGPADTFACLGHLGQYVLIIPSRHAVVVRLGDTAESKLDPVRDALGRLTAILPAPAAATGRPAG